MPTRSLHLLARFVSVPLLCALLALSGCARHAAPPTAKEPDYLLLDTAEAGAAFRQTLLAEGRPAWTELAPALGGSITYLARKDKAAPALTLTNQDGSRVVSWGDLHGTAEALFALLPELGALDDPEAALMERFDLYEVRPDILLTGYYEPWLEASLTPAPDYPVPLHGQPKDLKTVDLGRFHHRWKGQRLVYRTNEKGEIEPYHDRAAIDAGALAESAEPIAWAKDPVDAFFLQIQGSGRLALPDGGSRHILYAGKNGRPYVALGRVLKERGYLAPEDVSMQSIRRVLTELLATEPETAHALMAENPSYVFFRLADSGPYGASGARLTERVSVAADPKLLPLGSCLLLSACLPDACGLDDAEQHAGLALVQDTGGAVKGRHLDLFMGSDARGAAQAGHMDGRARALLLLLKADQ